MPSARSQGALPALAWANVALHAVGLTLAWFGMRPGSVASPLVQWIDDRGPSRGIAAALVFVGFIIVGALVVWMILRGVGTE